MGQVKPEFNVKCSGTGSNCISLGLIVFVIAFLSIPFLAVLAARQQAALVDNRTPQEIEEQNRQAAILFLMSRN